MPRVVTYCRVSSDEQAQKDLSIPAQRKAMQRWIADREDLELAEQFVDEGESAYTSADKRPGFCRMIAYCRKNKIDFILVHKLDRFSRNREESILFKSLLRRHGVTVKSITENFDPDTPQGFLYEGMVEVINQFYSMNLATETMKGMKENAERGYRNGGRAPYGYRVQKHADAGGRERLKLVLGPDDEVATVREMFRLAIDEEFGVKRIARVLNERGIPSPLQVTWAPGSVGVVLSNPVYAGKTVWNKKSHKSSGRNPPDKLVVKEDTHEPIIDPEVFLECRKALANRDFGVRRRSSSASEFLLARMIKCDQCGSFYYGRLYPATRKSDGKKYPNKSRYNCTTATTKGRAICPAETIPGKWIENAIIEMLRKEICSPEALASIRASVRKKIEARRSRYNHNPRELERKIADCDRRIQNFYSAIGNGVDAKQCKENIDRLEAKKAEVKAEAELLKEEDYYCRALEKNIAEIERLAATLGDDFLNTPLAAQRRVIRYFIEEIRVTRERRVKIKLRIPFDENGLHHLTDELELPDEGESIRTHRSRLESAIIEKTSNRMGASQKCLTGEPRVPGILPLAVVAQNALGYRIAGHSIFAGAFWITKNPILTHERVCPASTSARHRRFHSRMHERFGASRIHGENRRIGAQHGIDEVWHENLTVGHMYSFRVVGDFEQCRILRRRLPEDRNDRAHPLRPHLGINRGFPLVWKSRDGFHPASGSAFRVWATNGCWG
jgi:DNA invertase Pin-like site-specific DNA recombinase